MWMQQSVESAGFGNSHERNRFSQGHGFESSGGSGSYMGSGGGGGANNADWKSKILESGQWLGGKVIEYGGKLARGSSHDSIPEHMAHQPRNDGRANWMADIRNSSTSYSNTGSYSGSGASTYQNDFVTERPKAYSDTGFSQSSSSLSYSSKPPQAPFRDRTNSDKSDRRSKKKAVDAKRSKKTKTKHSKRREVSESEESSSESESESSASDSGSSSASESGDKRRHAKAKSKGKGSKKKHQKRRESFSSSEEETLEVQPKSKKTTSKPEKAPADYSFSFDPAKLPPPPREESASKKSRKDKKPTKSRGRRQSMESSESERSDKENQRTKKVTLKSKSSKKSSSKVAEMDLLGVDLTATPLQPAAPAFGAAPAHASQPDIFSQPLDPLQDLAGLNFADSYAQQQQVPAPVAFAVTPPAQSVVSQATDHSQVLNKLLPENDIVDLNFLASERKSNVSGSAAEKKTLAELQRERLGDQQQQQQQQLQYQQAMLLQQQQLQQPVGMMTGMQPSMAQSMMMQQQQAMHMQMRLGQMNSMTQQMQIQGQPQQQQHAMFGAVQVQGFQQIPEQKHNNGMQHLAYAPQ